MIDALDPGTSEMFPSQDSQPQVVDELNIPIKDGVALVARSIPASQFGQATQASDVGNTISEPMPEPEISLNYALDHIRKHLNKLHTGIPKDCELADTIHKWRTTLTEIEQFFY